MAKWWGQILALAAVISTGLGLLLFLRHLERLNRIEYRFWRDANDFEPILPAYLLLCWLALRIRRRHALVTAGKKSKELTDAFALHVLTLVFVLSPYLIAFQYNAYFPYFYSNKIGTRYDLLGIFLPFICMSLVCAFLPLHLLSFWRRRGTPGMTPGAEEWQSGWRLAGKALAFAFVTLLAAIALAAAMLLFGVPPIFSPA